MLVLPISAVVPYDSLISTLMPWKLAFLLPHILTHLWARKSSVFLLLNQIPVNESDIQSMWYLDSPSLSFDRSCLSHLFYVKDSWFRASQGPTVPIQFLAEIHLLWSPITNHSVCGLPKGGLQEKVIGSLNNDQGMSLDSYTSPNFHIPGQVSLLSF